ncbi:GNAT family N-acetyltransferase [Oscillospiraceae bacterium Marseille-Q3528]|nr:GNAT family N-acetyltransferase [Oscillospiraceae bacterium Marseille-Q3528]WNV57666.1 GNAT family N-acetyltransferase [Oscillospiraceae bacterium NTUH-002-81]
MYTKVTQKELAEVLDYYRQDRKNCLYSYIDLKKYGLGNPHLSVYIDRGLVTDQGYADTLQAETMHDILKEADTSQAGAADSALTAGALRCVLLQYYTGINVFSYKNNLDVPATVAFLQEKQPSMINGPLETLEKLYPYFRETYDFEAGYVTELLEKPKDESMSETDESDAETQAEFPVEKAGEAELPEIAALICTDEGVGGTYTPEGLAAQLLERQRDGFGRNYFIRQNGRIVCHAGTYAEVDDLAVVSGVITAEDSRGQNLADRVVSKLNKELLAEGKHPCLFYYTKSAARLYAKTGYAAGTGWAKLIRKQG